MNIGVNQFDTFAAKYVGYLPKWLHNPFVWLGRLTTPVLWASYLLVVQLLTEAQSIPNLGYSGWLIIILLPVASLIKLGFRRKRPPTIYTENMKIKSYSFPSSHAYSGTLGSLFLAQTLIQNGLSLGALCLAIGFLIGISRIFVGAHYPSDVLGGWALGVVVVLGCTALL
jgi:membrane-associated phospholipid phosphatase